ncbi:hypothetical protein SAMN05421736_11616 [Evansella caseinilytica]|uniref:Uncharacterized protein n=1 Tax=Evansella caseinilytica TaxID=1503961 RepID=A0A1H3TSV6_9BACI|nr:hypothetical protein [Evansella caseinilytica]SDZ53256.1 hypothetical protein SAMN05421736_11616 [Evansella caseinilytica]
MLQSVIQEALQPIQEKLNKMEAEQQSTRSQLDENTDIVKAIHDRQEETNATLEALSMDVHKLNGVVTEHNKKLDSIVNIQERQQRILETLALRSIEQETELRD